MKSAYFTFKHVNQKAGAGKTIMHLLTKKTQLDHM